MIYYKIKKKFTIIEKIKQKIEGKLYSKKKLLSEFFNS
jgi:hypothetical protein